MRGRSLQDYTCFTLNLDWIILYSDCASNSLNWGWRYGTWLDFYIQDSKKLYSERIFTLLWYFWIVLLFILAQIWKQLNSPRTDDWLNKLLYNIYLHIYIQWNISYYKIWIHPMFCYVDGFRVNHAWWICLNEKYKYRMISLKGKEIKNVLQLEAYQKGINSIVNYGA